MNQMEMSRWKASSCSASEPTISLYPVPDESKPTSLPPAYLFQKLYAEKKSITDCLKSGKCRRMMPCG